MKTKLVTGYDLKDGDVAYVQGHPMVVSEKTLQIVSNKSCPHVVRFVGTCTPDKANDSIRNTSYNGGTYGQLANLTYTVIEPEA